MKKSVLEHFKDIEDLETADAPDITVGHLLPYKCEQVRQALQRLEAIENAEPSKALECLDDIYRNGVFISEVSFTKQHPTHISPETNKSISEQCDTIKQALIQAEQYKKVLNSLIGKVIWVENGTLECGNKDVDCVLGFNVFPDEEEYTFICNFIEKMTEKKDRSE